MIELGHPWLIAVLAIVLPAVALAEIQGDGRKGRRTARMAARGALLSLLVLALADPVLTAPAPPPDRRLVLAVERSVPMGAAGEAEAAAVAQQAAGEALASGAAVSVLSFGAEAGSVRAVTAPLDAQPGREPGPRVATPRAAAGLAAAALAFLPGEKGTVLLLASGHGDLEALAEAARALDAAGLRVLARALPHEQAAKPLPRASLAGVDVPGRVRGPFGVRAFVEGRGPLQARVLVDGQELARATVEGTGTRQALDFEDLEVPPGRYELAVELVPLEAPAEARLERRLLQVETGPKVMLAVAHPTGSVLRQALTVQDFEVRSVPEGSLPAALEGSAPPADLLALDAAAAAALPRESREVLRKHVVAGMGLFLVAGDDPEAWRALAVEGLGGLLPVLPDTVPEPLPAEPPPEAAPESTPPSVESPRPEEGPGLKAERRPEEALPISLLLLLDRSGSMEGAKLTMAVEAARRAASMLARTDRVGVITFADEASLDVPPTPVARLGNLGWRLATLKADGNTDVYGALVAASQVLAREDAPIRHLVLLTDGRHTGREAVFGHLVGEMARAGITLTAVGLGTAHDEILLKQIAMWAPRGRYVPADTEAQLPTILTRDTAIVSERRRREAEALGRIQDPEREPEGREPDPPDSPRPPEPEVLLPEPEAPAEGPLLAPLRLVRPHEATAGLEREALPAVGAPRASKPRAGSALLLIRGDGEIVLAAARRGLGRTLVWAMPDDAPGLSTWGALSRLLVQAARSVRAPAGAYGSGVLASVLPHPDGERLRLDAPRGAPADPIRVVWQGPEGPVDLGLHTPGGLRDLGLPAAPTGALVGIRLLGPEGGLAGPALSYLARGSPRARARRGDENALAEALGTPALSPTEPLFGTSPPVPEPAPLWRYPLLLALLLLPFDVALHRRAGRTT